VQSVTTPKVAGINILSPSVNDDRLLFRVFDNASPIGYARLKKTSTPRKRPDNVVDMFHPDGSSSYELKMIEIAQNYRHRGLGTTLLREVIRFCRESNIRHLTGEIKGDSRTLRHWYQSNGFLVSSDNRIELLPPASC
jgi:ribosomal protein S18 acetylase RimI-like enzyme